MTTASIVTYRHTAHDIQPVLRSLFASPVDHIYIIDHSGNHSRLKESLSEVLSDEQQHSVTYIPHRNNGYGGGHNVALKHAAEEGGKYHLVVNPDVWFDRDVMPYLTDYMEQHPDVGQIMPKVYYPNGKIQKLTKLLPTPSDLIGRLCLPGWLIRKRNSRYELEHSGYTQKLNVPCLSGCFMFMRMEAIKQVGMFDERFFMYAEDFDMTRRIHSKYKTMFLPEKCIYHKFERASRKSPFLFYYHVASTVKYFNKWGWLKDSEREAYNRQVLEEIIDNS